MAFEQHFHNDLLRVTVLRRLVRCGRFPYLPQGLILIAVFLLIWNGWGIGMDRDASFLSVLRKTNSTTLLVWGLWWPSMILLAILAGRIWCTVCPMEFVNNLAHRSARRLGLPGLGMPRWLHQVSNGTGFTPDGIYWFSRFCCGQAWLSWFVF